MAKHECATNLSFGESDTLCHFEFSLFSLLHLSILSFSSSLSHFDFGMLSSSSFSHLDLCAVGSSSTGSQREAFIRPDQLKFIIEYQLKRGWHIRAVIKGSSNDYAELLKNLKLKRTKYHLITSKEQNGCQLKCGLPKNRETFLMFS